ncbi:MAG: hypothetical protein RL346_85 [Verrucomicrobiota bacterium]|jgi:hypothetical protein
MKHSKSLLLMAVVAASVGCATSHDVQPKALVVGTMDATPNKMKYVAQSPDGSVIRVSVAQEPYRESVHGEIRMDGELPTYALTEFKVSIDGVYMDIPARDYSHFGDPHIGEEFYPLKIEYIEPGLFYVYLSGGDGAGARKRRFVFSKQNWIRTEYRHPETWEYHDVR